MRACWAPAFGYGALNTDADPGPEIKAAAAAGHGATSDLPYGANVLSFYLTEIMEDHCERR